MIRYDGGATCDGADCEAVFLSPYSPDRRGLTEASMRRHGWGAFPGLTINGQPAPEHLCPTCRGVQAPAAPARGRGPKTLMGQEELLDTMCYGGHNASGRQGN